jgi:NAD(P)-dependent dehydrogenase (short-subunit alcohol dehydrogenase family)
MVHPSLDVLVNNAGGLFGTKTMSADNVEAIFALNTVAAFALASHLHDTLAQAHGRVVNIATGFGQNQAPRQPKIVFVVLQLRAC